MRLEVREQAARQGLVDDRHACAADAIGRLYEAGEYRAALDLLDARSADFPAVGHRCKITFFRACLLARAGAPDAASDLHVHRLVRSLPRRARFPRGNGARETGLRLEIVTRETEARLRLIQLDHLCNLTELMTDLGGGGLRRGGERWRSSRPWR